MLRYLILGVVLLLTACSQRLNESPGITYGKSVEQLGIFAVYPPREDLQVGDLYAVEAHSLSSRLAAKTAYVDTIDLTKEIKKYLQTRYLFGKTEVDDNSGKVELALEQSDKSGRGVLFQKSKPDFLPIAGFPEVEVNTGLSVAVGTLQPGTLFGAVFGGNASRTLKMRLRFDHVTSYSVPIPIGQQYMYVLCNSPDNPNRHSACSSDNLASIINDKYQLSSSHPEVVKEASILLITKVYLARQIDYIYSDALLAAAAARQFPTGADKNPIVVNQSTVQAAVDKDDPELIKALADLQSSLNTSLGNLDATGGSSVSLSAINSNGITFTQIFARPVVVGYEGIGRVAN